MNIIAFQLQIIMSLVLSLVMVACSDGVNYAPVCEINTIDAIPQTGFHLVTTGETLYEIAWRYGLDYRYLAERNRLKSPYSLRIGQKILLQGGNATVIALSEPEPQVSNVFKKPPSTITSKMLVRSEGKTIQTAVLPSSRLAFTWPAKGKIIGSFSGLRKGINIAGAKGEPIYATANGKVVYCGNGLRGYGNLIILKHNSLYLSAYAHNRQVLVKEGDMVSQGQQIAEMGDTGTDKVMLHFEIRHAGKPVDPISLLNG